MPWRFKWNFSIYKQNLKAYLNFMQTQKFNFGLYYRKEKGAIFFLNFSSLYKKNLQKQTNKNKPYIYI